MPDTSFENNPSFSSTLQLDASESVSDDYFPDDASVNMEGALTCADHISLTQGVANTLPTWTVRPPSPNSLFGALAEVAKLKCAAVPGPAAQSPRSPWLPSTPNRRAPAKQRRVDPMKAPESVGLVLPSWLPYASPPPSSSVRSGGDIVRKTPPSRWSSRHHVCDSKDNRRLPRLQRAYFDDLPHTRCQGGVYQMVPGHKSFNFDQFCASPAHIQHQDLHRHFERYPFVESHAEKLSRSSTAKTDSFTALELARTPSVLTSSEGSESRGQSPEPSAQSGTEDATTCSGSSPRKDDTAWSGSSPRNFRQSNGAETSTSCVDVRGSQNVGDVAAAWPDAEGNHPRRMIMRQTSRLESDGDRCTCGNLFVADAKYCRKCGLKRTNGRGGNEDDFRGTTTTDPAVHNIRSSLGGMHNIRFSTNNSNLVRFSVTLGGLDGKRMSKRKKKKREADREAANMWRCSVFAKGGVPQFHAWCVSKFGSLVRLWRCLDVHNNMRVGQGQFLRGLQDLGYAGDVRELFKALNRDQTGTLLFFHFAPAAALSVADLLSWARNNYGSLAQGVGLTNAVDQRSFITRQQFIQMCKKKGYTNEESLQYTFDLIDKDGDGNVVRTEVAQLDKWEFPEWLTAKEDREAAAICRNKLLLRCHGNSLLAWRHLNRGGSMRVAWNDFKHACRKLLSTEDCQHLPSAWRVLDNDLSGWLSLREFDRDAYDKLMSFLDWAHDAFGSVIGGFPKLIHNKDGKISLTEFRHACKQSGLEDEVVSFIFSGLDVDCTGTITANEVRFLDQWKATSDLKEEEAWAQMTFRTPQKKGPLKKGSSFRKFGTQESLGKRASTFIGLDSRGMSDDRRQSLRQSDAVQHRGQSKESD